MKKITNSISSHRQYLTQIGKSLGIRNKKEWYNVKPRKYLDVESVLLSFPEYYWEPWRFSHLQVPKGYWGDVSNQRNFFLSLALKMSIMTWDEWYTIKISDIVDFGGKGLLKYYDDSAYKAISAIFREVKWDPWKFGQTPKGFWDDISNQRSFLESLAKNLKLEKMEDWYAIRNSDIIDFGGSSLLARSKDSFITTLKTAFPEYDWKPWLFTNMNLSKDYWMISMNQKSFLEFLKNRFQFKTLDEFYSLNNSDIIDNGGSGLLCIYNNSLIRILSNFYPNHDWKAWKFSVQNSSKHPIGFWKDLDNQRNYFNEIQKSLHISQLSDWTNVSVSQVLKLKGSGILQYYNYSLMKAISTIYDNNSNFNHNYSNGKKLTSDSKENSISKKKTQTLLCGSLKQILEYPLTIK